MKTLSDYTILCTPEQTKKALELGAPIEILKYNSTILKTITTLDGFAIIPTAEQMIGWLEEQGIWIHFCKPNQRPELLSYSVSNMGNPFRRVFVGGEFPTRKEATLASIDAALEYLTKNNKKL